MYSLINILTGEEFNPDYESTEYCSYKNIEIDLGQNKKGIFYLWDTMGQNRFRDLVKIFLANSICVVIGYDINNKKNFEEAKNFWYPLVKESGEYNLIYLIGNKI